MNPDLVRQIVVELKEAYDSDSCAAVDESIQKLFKLYGLVED